MKPFWFCLTDKGKVREENEDSFYEPVDESPESLKEKGFVFAVADGMGGYEGGKLAGSIAVKAVREFYRKPLEPDSDENSWKQRSEAFMKSMITRINHYIYGSRYLSDDLPAGMGSTLTGVLIKNKTALAFNVGDSRVYHFSSKKGFRQITRDHSKTQPLVEQGLITAEGARNHPDHNVVTRSLGTGPEKGIVEPDIFSFSLCAGDQILICSDGLTDMVEDEMLAQLIMLNSSDLEGNVRKMIDEALKKGGYDNITVILIQMRDEKLPDQIEETPADNLDELPSDSFPEENDWELLPGQEDETEENNNTKPG